MPHGHVEREFKLKLRDATAAEAVAHALGAPRAAPVLQRNHFFDTRAGDLRAARIALRLREEAGAFVLTLKGPARRAGPLLAERPEEECALTAERAREVLEGRRAPLEEFPRVATRPLVQAARTAAAGRPLVHLGCFENARERLGPVRFAGIELTFELDATRFPDGAVEHELEVEFPAGPAAEGIERELRHLFARLGLPCEPAPSKAARFFARLEGGSDSTETSRTGGSTAPGRAEE